MDDKVIKLQDKDFHTSKLQSYNNSEEGNKMEKYVNRQELEAVQERLSHQVELNQAKTNAKLELMDEKFNRIFDKMNNMQEVIPDKIQLALDEKSKEEHKEAIETRRYILGTIIIGVLGIVISLFF